MPFIKYFRIDHLSVCNEKVSGLQRSVEDFNKQGLKWNEVIVLDLISIVVNYPPKNVCIFRKVHFRLLSRNVSNVINTIPLLTKRKIQKFRK